MAWILSHPVVLVVMPLVIAPLVWGLAAKSRGLAVMAALTAPLLTLGAGLSALASAGGSLAGHGSTGWTHGGLVAPEQFLSWFDSSSNTLAWAFGIDALTALTLVVVGVVATCVMVFSVGYMAHEESWGRYFALLAAFTGSMNLLVLSSSLTGLFAGWELVGACSYLLIGFWFEKPTAVAAAKKAFLTTRVGDVGLLIGIAVLVTQTGTDTYRGIVLELTTMAPWALTVAAVCIAIGAMGKSAQFPLHAWLPDAMEGPTPVSALIHAATMVAAGVFLVARLWPLFEVAAAARLVLLWAGTISALGAAAVAVVATDIKKVLAYSTVSQLGFMFAALGASAWVAAIFHLIAHAAFKAMLFLASGSVIHGTGTQDIREMGGLRRSMPTTFLVWTVGVLALAGVFPLSGFFSKDAILEAVLHNVPWVAVLLFVAGGLTALYSARVTRAVFFGEPVRAHESPKVMLVPLLVLAVPAVGLGGAAGSVSIILGHEPEPLALVVSLIALGLAGAGGVVGWILGSRTVAQQSPAADFLASGYGWDGLVERLVNAPLIGLSRGLWAIGDRFFIDGAAMGLARVARFAGRGLSRLHSGDTQAYSSMIVVGLLLMLIAASWIGR